MKTCFHFRTRQTRWKPRWFRSNSVTYIKSFRCGHTTAPVLFLQKKKNSWLTIRADTFWCPPFDFITIVIIPNYSCSATLIISRITGIYYILLECLWLILPKLHINPLILGIFRFLSIRLFPSHSFYSIKKHFVFPPIIWKIHE